MRKLFAATLLFLTVAIPAMAGDTVRTEKIDRTLEVTPTSRLILGNVNGKVFVRSWAQPRVRVIATKKAESGSDSDAKDALSKVKVTIENRGGNIVVQSEHPRMNSTGLFDWIFGNNVSVSVQYDVYVPASMSIDVDNTNGTINLDGLTGRAQLETTNGRIEVARCSGPIDASTTNGGIRAELGTMSNRNGLRFETTNGRITITVPSNFAADIDAATTNGSVSTDLPVATTRVSKESLRGTINGGGSPLRLRTTNGSIEIRSK